MRSGGIYFVLVKCKEREKREWIFHGYFQETLQNNVNKLKRTYSILGLGSSRNHSENVS